MSTQNALLTILVEKIKNDTLVLPTLPAIALKVRQSADNPDINLAVMADVIGQDPSLSARMIKIANSAYFGRSVKVASTSQAVTRIGLSQVKNVATALAMEQLFVSKNDIVKKYMAKVWIDTVEIVAHALACMQIYQQGQSGKDLNLDTMTLCALMANIGALPVLTEAERHDNVFANPTFLDVAIERLSGRIGGGIMRAWQFNDVFIECAEYWRDLSFNKEQVSYIDFLRLGAALSGQTENKQAYLDHAKVRGVYTDEAVFQSDEYLLMCDNAREIFA